ncbi:hypothetical protein GGR13_001148 [Brevundimonas variabilis]|uniref:Uncharacterized protein n=1 Tax=Brevundimonas variabilis TaxID=74312 RepID=A0A7W9CH88_9CAUL|nr:hypothetical protein [Brevundimonas variabilis]
MDDFILSDLVGVLPDDRIDECNLTPASHRSLRPHTCKVGSSEACAECGKGIELRLKIFQVQRKVQNGEVGSFVTGWRVLCDGISGRTAARAEDSTAGGPYSKSAAELEEISTIIATFNTCVERIQNQIGLGHGFVPPVEPKLRIEDALASAWP